MALNAGPVTRMSLFRPRRGVGSEHPGGARCRIGVRNIPVNVSFLQDLLVSVAEQGRQLLPRSLGGTVPKDDLHELATALLSGRGEASGVAIASAILARYRAVGDEERRAFLGFLATLQ